ncbi:hypothetical protein ACFWB1_01685 [Streptomyces goshikiensis]|nr:hypothetical protein [Streptomyces sp. ADI95-16]AYV31220.1 hypothetical protein EES41_31280 [Streptomyces sp. ADI95-16]
MRDATHEPGADTRGLLQQIAAQPAVETAMIRSRSAAKLRQAAGGGQ